MKKFWIAMAIVAAALIGLKLADYIDWSWWIVTAPIWVPIVVIKVALELIWELFD